MERGRADACLPVLMEYFERRLCITFLLDKVKVFKRRNAANIGMGGRMKTDSDRLKTQGDS